MNKMGSKRKTPARGSYEAGWLETRNANPRVVVMFSAEVFGKLRGEAEEAGVPFSEIVRRRVAASYTSIEQARIDALEGAP